MSTSSRRSSSDDDLKRYIGQWKSKPEIVKNHFVLNLKSNNSSSSSVESAAINDEPRTFSSQSESSLPTTPVSPTSKSSSTSVGSFQFMSRLAGESMFSPSSSSSSNRRQRTVSLCSPDDVLIRQQNWSRFEQQQQQQQQQQQHQQNKQNLLKTANFYIGAVDSSSKTEPLSSFSSPNDILQVKDEVVGRKRSISFTENFADFYD